VVALPRTILVVDDEVSIREILDRTLREAGYSVLTAAEGGEALAIFDAATQPIEVVVTDLVMPGGMGGQQLAARLGERSPAPYVIFMTGFTSPRTRAALPGLVFDKPVEHERLLACLANLPSPQ
jgi:DNA-binding NtrC family response regulator